MRGNYHMNLWEKSYEYMKIEVEGTVYKVDRWDIRNPFDFEIDAYGFSIVVPYRFNGDNKLFQRKGSTSITVKMFHDLEQNPDEFHKFFAKLVKVKFGRSVAFKIIRNS